MNEPHYRTRPGAEAQRLPLVEANHRLWILRTNVIGAWSNEAIVRILLKHVGRPTRNAASHKNRREEIYSYTKGVIRRRGIKIDGQKFENDSREKNEK